MSTDERLDEIREGLLLTLFGLDADRDSVNDMRRKVDAALREAVVPLQKEIAAALLLENCDLHQTRKDLGRIAELQAEVERLREALEAAEDYDRALGEGYRVLVRAIGPDGKILVTYPALTDPDRSLAATQWPNPTTAREVIATAQEVIKRVTEYAITDAEDGKRIAEFEDERDRYRNALGKIKGYGVWNEQHQRRDFEMIEIAREALAGREEKTKP